MSQEFDAYISPVLVVNSSRKINRRSEEVQASRKNKENVGKLKIKAVTLKITILLESFLFYLFIYLFEPRTPPQIPHSLPLPILLLAEAATRCALQDAAFLYARSEALPL